MSSHWRIVMALTIFALVLPSLQQHRYDVGTPQFPEEAATAESSSSTWDEVSHLDLYDSKRLREFITPLVAMAANTYNASRPVPGWRILQTFSPASPSEAGARAVLFQEESETTQDPSRNRLVLTFRGTASKADKCVDRIFFGDDSPVATDLPTLSWCRAEFSNQSLDYLSQSLTYTRNVVKLFPGAPLLLSGHSLGAALAALVSVSVMNAASDHQSSDLVLIPAVGFSSPGGRDELQRRGVVIGSGEQRGVFVIGDEWDMIVRTFWQQRLGTVCTLNHDEPPDCGACLWENDSNACSRCDSHTHKLDNILSLLDRGATINCTKPLVQVSSV